MRRPRRHNPRTVLAAVRRITTGQPPARRVDFSRFTARERVVCLCGRLLSDALGVDGPIPAKVYECVCDQCRRPWVIDRDDMLSALQRASVLRWTGRGDGTVRLPLA